MRIDRFPSIPETVPLPLRRKPEHRLQLVPLADDLVAAFFDAPGHESVVTSQLAAWSGDEALCRPLLGTRLARRDGGLRYVFFLARSSRDLCRRGLWIARDEAPLAEIDPSALQSPVVDALALVVGLSPEGEARLLRALLTTGLSLFGDRAFPGIRDIVLQLLERLAPPALALRAWCPLGGTAAIASYTLPRDLAAEPIGSLVAIGSGSAQLLPGVETDVETLGDDRLLHLFLPRGLKPGTTLVALSETPLRLAGPAPAQRQRPLGPWLQRRSPPVRRRTLARLDRLAAADATAAALLAEANCPDRARPEVVPQLVSCTSAGIFYIVALRDPRRLLANLLLRTGQGDILLPVGTPLHHPRLGPIQLGYARATQDCAPGDRAEIFALYRSGRMTRVGELALDPLPAEVPPLLNDLPDAAVAPALAAALADSLRDRPDVPGEVIEIAAPEAAADVTLLVELDGALDYPFALAASLAGHRRLTLMLHHPDPRARAALTAIGEELHAIYGFGVALFDIAEEGLKPAERLRAALAHVPTDAAVVLSGDVLPERRPWLGPWLDRLAKPGPVLAAAATIGHDAGPGERVAADPDETDFTRAFGLNAAARQLLASMPLRVSGREADIADLAATLRTAAGAGAVQHQTVAMIAHARPPRRPGALDLAERLTIAETRTA